MAKLGDCISAAKVQRCGDMEYPILSITMKDGIVLQSEKFKKRIASAETSKYICVPYGKLVQGIHIDEGNFGVQSVVPVGIVSPAYKIWDINEGVVIPKYIEMVLRSPRCIEYYRSKLTGTVNRRGRMSTKDFLDMDIPLPDKGTQQRIVDLMNQVNALMNLRQTEIELIDQMVKSRFIELFGSEAELDRWPCCTIGDVADVCVGVVIKPTQYYTDKGIPAFRSLNIGEMRVKDADWVYFTEEGHRKNQKSVIHKNDVLVVRSGAPGTACVATEKYEGYNAVDIIIAHPDNRKVNSVFLAAYTNMPHGMTQIREKTGGAAQQHFNVGGYKAMRLIMPPMELQQRFAAFVEQTDKSKLCGEMEVAA